MAPIFAIIRYALLETFFCIPILPKTTVSNIANLSRDHCALCGENLCILLDCLQGYIDYKKRGAEARCKIVFQP